MKQEFEMKRDKVNDYLHLSRGVSFRTLRHSKTPSCVYLSDVIGLIHRSKKNGLKAEGYILNLDGNTPFVTVEEYASALNKDVRAVWRSVNKRNGLPHLRINKKLALIPIKRSYGK